MRRVEAQSHVILRTATSIRISARRNGISMSQIDLGVFADLHAVAGEDIR